ncbi:hypothetical protein [Pinirhizobacter sp.]|jgi:hypothetical protein|uniref:hypothetical protein n=1 Tax=Pinirhizobacter sp. TaxID=2950432 RepID=UPI002F41A359
MTTITISNASPRFHEASSRAASENSAAKVTASDMAVSELASERATDIAPHGADIILTTPSSAAQVPQELARVIASVIEGSQHVAHINPMMNDAATTAARMLMENPALDPLDMLDQIDPMLAQSVTATNGLRTTLAPAEGANKRDEDTVPGVGNEGDAPATSPSMDRLKALIALLILADLLRDSAKEDQAAQLRLNVASTKISADQLVSAAKANVAGAAAGLALTAGLAGAGTMKILGGNKDTRTSINDNLKVSNRHTASSNEATSKANKLAANEEVEINRLANNGNSAAYESMKAEQKSGAKELVERPAKDATSASAAHTKHLLDSSYAQDKIAYGQPLMQGAAAASQIAVQSGFYAASMNQQASTLAKSDADVAQGTADTERDSAAAHAEVSAKMLQILQAIARQEFERNSTIVIARAA